MMSKLHSNVLDTDRANISFELVKVISLIVFVVYHVSLVAPKSGNLFLHGIMYICRMGWIGSDILLALAGFLFVQSVNKMSENKNYSFLIFKKFLRTAIPYYIFLILYLYAGSWFFNYIGQGWKLKEGYGIALFGFSVNWLLAFGSRTGVALEGMYSLAIGVQLVFVSSVIFILVKNKKCLIILYLVLEIIAISIRLLFEQGNIWQFYFITFTRLDAFVLGVLISFIRTNYFSGNNWKNIAKRLFFISMLILIFIAIITKGLSMWSHLTSKIAYPFIAFFAASLVLFAYENNYQGRFKNQIWNTGKATYTVYLVKLPAVYFMVVSLNRIGIENKYAQGLLPYFLSIIFCFSIGLLWWIIFEKRFLSLIFTNK